MRHIILTLIILATAAATAVAASLTIEGSSHPVIVVKPEKSTGLDEILVVFSTRGCTAVYTASAPGSQVTWQKFGYMGAGYAEDVDRSLVSQSGTRSVLSIVEPDMGYAVTENGRTYYVWVTDYSSHPCTITGLSSAPEQECDRTFLTVEGQAPRIVYHTITGQGLTLSRDIKLTYNTLVATDDNTRYNQVPVEKTIEYTDGSINVEAPLCNTTFHLHGDRFLEQWGMAREVTSPLIDAQCVQALVSAKKVVRTAENEVKTEDTLGGSAPVEIEFSATPSDAAIFTEWQMATDAEFNNIVYRNQQIDFSHTFYEMGTTYVRFMAANASGSCEFYSETYTVNIGESSLLCPNAFSPGATPGVNDEWRVSYKSIIEFECYIFNRWGKKLAEFHNPAQGWDGKDGGKSVPAGVYYYVIKAKGADGKKYDLSGDINILNYTD